MMLVYNKMIMVNNGALNSAINWLVESILYQKKLAEKH